MMIMIMAMKHFWHFHGDAFWWCVFVSFQPQVSMPDVIIWMISGDKRIAYYRMPAHQLLFSETEAACGKFCGKTVELQLKVFVNICKNSAFQSRAWSREDRQGEDRIWLVYASVPAHMDLSIRKGHAPAATLTNWIYPRCFHWPRPITAYE